MGKFLPNKRFVQQLMRNGGSVETGLTFIATDLLSDVALSFRGQKSGNVYEVRGTAGGSRGQFRSAGRIIPWKQNTRPKDRKRGKRHIASAPGETPAVLFGKLSQALSFRVDTIKDGLSLKLGSNVPYARRLEYGDPDEGFPARPYMRPALIRKFPSLAKTFEDSTGFRTTT